LPNILADIIVLDLTQNVAGPYCTQLLGDLGATVIKVERPGMGDDTRQWSRPSWQGESATFLGLNRNKKSISVDLNDPKGQEIVCKLAEQADVLVHSMKPGSAEARGIGYDSLSERNPNLIYAAISAFGDEGPLKSYPGYDPLIQAYTGIMSVTGNEGDNPVRVGVSIIDMAAGMWSLIGILSAIINRNQTGTGSKVTNSLLETGMAWVSLQLTNYMATGTVPGKIGTPAPMIAPYEAFKAKDGWTIIAAGNDRLFSNLCKALDMQVLLEDPKFKTNDDRVQNRHELHQLIEQRTLDLEMNNLLAMLREDKVPCSPINTLDKIYQDEQVEALQLIKEIDNFRVSGFKIVDMPFKINNERGSIRLLPPTLGEHTDEILKALGYTDEEISALKQKGTAG
jgi:crotonobetainyl-CoA:carnitine CoA-transferase CaiB-like acyl-CoA transferase